MHLQSIFTKQNSISRFHDALRTKLCTSIYLLVLCWSLSAQSSEELPVPTGQVLFEISGSITTTNSDGSAKFDYAMLETLGLIEKPVSTAWTDEGTRFEGVLTRELMNLVGASGTEIHAEAHDGYKIVIPLSDFTEFETMLALSMNGERMGLRTKGPAWIIYDNTSRPEASDTVLQSRMIWQLRKLTIQ